MSAAFGEDDEKFDFFLSVFEVILEQMASGCISKQLEDNFIEVFLFQCRLDMAVVFMDETMMFHIRACVITFHSIVYS